jgi:predicted site-specific integrase-resolvase
MLIMSDAVRGTLLKRFGDRVVISHGEAAELLEVTPATLAGWVKAGRIGCVQHATARKVRRQYTLDHLYNYLTGSTERVQQDDLSSRRMRQAAAKAAAALRKPKP